MDGPRIEVNIADIEKGHVALEQASAQLRGLKFDLPQGVSKSAAMDAFRVDVKAFGKLVSQYAALLDGDCLALLDAIQSVVDADEAIAKSYLGSVGDERGKARTPSSGDGVWY